MQVAGKVYGGSLHGKTMAFDRREFVVRHNDPICRFIPRAPGVNDYAEEKYVMQRYGRSEAFPRRYRRLNVLVADGYSPSPVELREIERQLNSQPWEYPAVSIIEEFDEWFAQAVLRHTGLLTWRGVVRDE